MSKERRVAHVEIASQLRKHVCADAQKRYPLVVVAAGLPQKGVVV
jgi:hypothetical protein